MRATSRKPAALEAADAILAIVRRVLMAILLLGIIGTGVELLFIGHYEEVRQIIPLALMTAALLVSFWHLVAPGRASTRTLQATMLAFIASGVVGIAFHYRGNAEFELEMYPSLAGLELMRATLTGATPVLAPGTMVLLGLIGLAHSYRHPTLAHGAAARRSEDVAR